MDLNVRCDTLKLPEEELGSAHQLRGPDKDFVNGTPMKQNKTQMFLYNNGNWQSNKDAAHGI